MRKLYLKNLLMSIITLNYHPAEDINSKGLACFETGILSFERDDDSLIEISLIESNRRI